MFNTLFPLLLCTSCPLPPPPPLPPLPPPLPAVIPHIASLVLGYDMRRLNDITAFRRYWYSTSLVETLFIGSKSSKPREEEPVLATPTDAKSSSTLTSEDESTSDIDNTISATIAVAANVEDFRVAANFAQVMGHAE